MTQNQCAVADGDQFAWLFHHHYKVQSSEENYRSGSDWFLLNDKKGKWKQIFSSTDVNAKNKYKPPTESELKNIVKLLEGTQAQKIAINILADLQK